MEEKRVWIEEVQMRAEEAQMREEVHCAWRRRRCVKVE